MGDYMKAQDLRLEELVRFEEGNIHLYGRRLVLHSIDAFTQFRKDLVEMLGLEDARRAMTRFGFFWGEADAAAMKRVFKWDDPLELMKAAFRLQCLEGVALPDLKVLAADHRKKVYHFEVTWHRSMESDQHMRELGISRHPACWNLIGYASGCATFSIGTDIYFLEEECKSRGDSICRAVGKDRVSWGKDIQPYLKYFEAEDIKGTVASLTEQLKERTRELAREREKTTAPSQPEPSFFMEGRSKALQEVLLLSNRVALFDSSVLFTGETGVGKEVLARHVHSVSHRSKGPFVTVNCAALPETLLESELFGHKRGSFTGAIRDRVGLFEQASGGTVFLDEIGEISHAMQLRVLRVLQEKEVVRVGENLPRKIDVRVIAATNKDLDKAVSDGEFREDLLYRLKVVEIRLPPLRERGADVLPLARFIVKKLSKRLKIPNLHLDATTVDYLHSYDWPGNVRELENALERASILSRDGVIVPENLPPSIVEKGSKTLFKVDSTAKPLAQVEIEYINAVLRSVQGNRTMASRILGIGSSTLWRKLKDQNKNG
jgi:DNA-binding NtrC family response regulator